MIAIASGSFSGGSWWSVIITSIPSETAIETSSSELIPQSTVIIRPAPRD